MTAALFAAALGVEAPWSVPRVDFDQSKKLLTILNDFKAGSRFAVAGAEGSHPVHDTTTKSYRHLNFFQHECHLEVRVPRVKLPDGSVRLVEPAFAGKLKGFTLLFEAPEHPHPHGPFAHHEVAALDEWEAPHRRDERLVVRRLRVRAW